MKRESMAALSRSRFVPQVVDIEAPLKSNEPDKLD